MKILLPIELTNGNDGRKKSWFKASRIRKTYEDLLRLQFGTRSPFSVPVNVVVVRILGLTCQMWDSSSILRGNYKEIEDSMVACGWFHDDNSRWIKSTFGVQDSTRRHMGPAVELIITEHRDAIPAPKYCVEQIATKLAKYVMQSQDRPSVIELAEVSGCEYHSLYRFLRSAGIYEPGRTHSKIDPTKDRQVKRMLCKTNMTRREIAKKMAISKGSVDRRATELRQKIVGSASTEQEFTKRSWRCPVHGPVQYDPCIACTAEAKKSK